jgi:beta-lactamase regulating signal transducer with metallopeptidase domain
MSAWIAQSLLASTISMLAVMAVRRPLRAWLGAKIVYALWLLPLFRLAMPWLTIPGWPPSLSIHGAQLIVDPGVMSGTTSAISTDWSLLATFVWATGAILHLTWHTCRYCRFTRLAFAGTTGGPVHIGTVDVWTSAFVEGPAAAGIVRRLIFLPIAFNQRFDHEERRLAIAHELMHHRRHDIPANLAALVVLSIHWFDPFAHLAHRLFRLDQEMACDADVLTEVGVGYRQAYGRTLAKAAIRAPALSMSALSGVDLLKLRLRGLAGPHCQLETARPVILALIGAGLVATAPLAVFSPPVVRKPLLESANKHTAKAGSVVAEVVQGLAMASGGVCRRAAALRRPARAVQTATESAGTSAGAALPGPPQLEPATLAHTDAAYLSARREQGMAASRQRFASPVQAALARGRPMVGAGLSAGQDGRLLNSLHGS